MLCDPQRSPNDDGDNNRGRSQFEAMRRENYNDEEEDVDGQVRCDSRGDPPRFETTTTMTTMIRTMTWT